MEVLARCGFPTGNTGVFEGGEDLALSQESIAKQQVGATESLWSC